MPQLTDKQKLRIALRALKLADGILEYCPGDQWEQEATKKDRDKFDKLYGQLLGKEGSA